MPAVGTSRWLTKVYQISFGSFWWPAEPEKIWAFLEAVMELKIPFVRFPLTKYGSETRLTRYRS
jgi:hypothetical protein